MATDVITGSAFSGGMTLDEHTATAVFQDAIARVAGVDIDSDDFEC